MSRISHLSSLTEVLSSTQPRANKVAEMAFSHLSKVFSRARTYAPTARDTSYMLLGFATWIPAFMFVNSHVAEVVWINGPSMYPYLNTDFHRTLKKDLCINWKWAPLEDIRRGMIVTFWLVSSTPSDANLANLLGILPGVHTTLTFRL
jgi:mitochondrial inner membrane protease subunit 2